MLKITRRTIYLQAVFMVLTWSVRAVSTATVI